MKEMLGGCCVCADENGWSTNPLVYCDGINCEVAVHQGCYGIVEVPDGEWLCAKCTAINSGQQLCAPRCELCPFGFGALKRTESNGWAHVICALYIPEVRFGDVHSMDPVIIADVPDERYQRHCYLCEELGNEERAALGACMSCNRPGCKKGFHVTCAQQRGLLCEEGGGSKNVKYCGYCSQHAKKAANDPSIKIIPPYRVRSSGLNGSSRSNESAAAKTTSATNGPSSTNAVQSNRNIRSTDQQLITDEIAPRDGNSVDAKNHPHYSIAINRNNSKRSSPAKSSSSTANNLEMLAAASIVPCSSHVDDATSTGSKEQQPSSLSSVVVQPSAESVVQTGTAAAASSNNATTLMQSSLSNSIHTTNGGGEGDQTIAGDCASADPLRPPSSGSQVISTNRQHSHDKLYDDDAICDRLLTRSPNRTTIDCSSSSTTDSAVATPLAYPSTSAGPKNSSGKRGRPPSCDNGALPSPHSVVKAETTTTTVDRIAGEKPPKRPRPSRSKQTVKALLELVNPVVQETVTDFQRDRVAAQQGAAAAAAAAALLSSAGTMPNTTTVSYQPSTSASMTHEYHHHAADSSNGIAPIIGGAPPLRPTPKLGLISPEQQHDHQGFSGPSSLPFVSTTSNNPFPTSLEQLLERQWEQGSQFLMGQAQHFDIASLLSCLHQLKTENVRLEENMMQLASRRDHLLAVNARLSLALAPASTATSVNSTTSPHQSPRIIAAGNATSIHQQPSSSSIPHSATLTLASLGLPGMHHAMQSVANVDNEPLSQLRTLATACGSSSSTANAASTNRISPSMMLMMTPSSSSSVLVNAAAVSNSQPTKSSSSSSQTTQANFSSSLHSGHQSSVNVSASPNTSTTGVGAFGSNTGVFSSVRIPHMPAAVASQQQQQQKQQQQRIDSPPSSIAGAAAGFLVPRTPLINPTTGNPLQSYSGLSPQDQILQQLMIAQHQQLLANAYSMHQQQQQQQQQQVVVTTGANQSRSSSSSTVSLTSSAPASGKTS